MMYTQKDNEELSFRMDMEKVLYDYFNKRGFEKFVVKCMTGEHPLDNMTAEFEFDTNDDDWFDLDNWDESYASIEEERDTDEWIEVKNSNHTQEAIAFEVNECFAEVYFEMAYEIGNEDDFKYELDECTYEDGKITLKFINKK